MKSKLIFRKEKCIAALRAKGLPESSIQTSLPWIDMCDGKEVIRTAADGGDVVGTEFGAHIDWCEEVLISE